MYAELEGEHARIAGPFARNCVKLHPMDDSYVGEYLARASDNPRSNHGESRGCSRSRERANDVMGYSQSANPG